MSGKGGFGLSLKDLGFFCVKAFEKSDFNSQIIFKLHLQISTVNWNIAWKVILPHLSGFLYKWNVVPFSDRGEGLAIIGVYRGRGCLARLTPLLHDVATCRGWDVHFVSAPTSQLRRYSPVKRLLLKREESGVGKGRRVDDGRNAGDAAACNAGALRSRYPLILNTSTLQPWVMGICDSPCKTANAPSASCNDSFMRQFHRAALLYSISPWKRLIPISPTD